MVTHGSHPRRVTFNQAAPEMLAAGAGTGSAGAPGPGGSGQTAERHVPRDDGAADGPAAIPGRYGLLLVVLVVTYLIAAFTSARWVSVLQVLLFAGAAILALRTSALPAAAVRLAALAALGTSLLVVVLALVLPADAGYGIGGIWAGLVLLLAAVFIVHRVLSFPDVTAQSIYGAFSAYLIIGFMFAACYGAMEHLGGAFFVHGEQNNTQTFQYFSFVTLTTLGYGDFTAANSDGRAVAVLEALVGQVFLATLVARLVAAYRPTSAEPAKTPRGRSAGEDG